MCTFGTVKNEIFGRNGAECQKVFSVKLVLECTYICNCGIFIVKNRWFPVDNGSLTVFYVIYSKLVINHIAMEICRNIVPVWQLRILIAVMMRTPNDG